MKIKLRQAFDLQMGKTPARNRPDYWSGDRKWISIADIGNTGKYITETKESITEAGIEGSGIKVVPQGTVIMSFKLSIGKTAITSEGMYTNEAIMAFIDNGKFAVDTDYLYHLCCGTNWTAGTNKAVMGLTLNKATLLEKEIPLPDINEQHEIANKLDKIDAIIAERQQQLALIDQAVKSRFIELFGDPLIEDDRYPRVPLGSLAEVGSSKRIFEKEYVSEGIPFYRTKEIVELSKGNRITTELFITKERYDQIRSEYGAPQKGDLLISAVGTIGVIWIVDGKNNFYFKDGNLLRVSATEKFVPEYLKYLLEALISAYKSEMSSGTAYAALTISALKEMMVYDVPHAEQEQFAAFVEQTDKSKYYSSLSFRYCQAAANTYRQEWMTCRTSDF